MDEQEFVKRKFHDDDREGASYDSSIGKWAVTGHAEFAHLHYGRQRGRDD